MTVKSTHSLTFEHTSISITFCVQKLCIFLQHLHRLDIDVSVELKLK